MSRSNPTSNNPHPCERWFEWKGGTGGIEYYDKNLKEKVDVPLPFNFLVLDETATVRGWHDASESGIMSNEVRDTRSDVMVVKAFKGGELCHGLYSTIRDRVASLGGHFSTNLYLGFRTDNGPLRLGCLQLKGAALNAWVEFKKANIKAVGSGAICIASCKAGKKGSVNFQTPVFTTKDIKPETNEEAVELDKVLQTYLTAYFSRTKVEQASAPLPPPAAAEPDNDHPGLAPAAAPTASEPDAAGDEPW